MSVINAEVIMILATIYSIISAIITYIFASKYAIIPPSNRTNNVLSNKIYLKLVTQFTDFLNNFPVLFF